MPNWLIPNLFLYNVNFSDRILNSRSSGRNSVGNSSDKLFRNFAVFGWNIHVCCGYFWFPPISPIKFYQLLLVSMHANLIYKSLSVESQDSWRTLVGWKIGKAPFLWCCQVVKHHVWICWETHEPGSTFSSVI